MNPLVPTPTDVVCGVLATVNSILILIALFIVWSEYAEERNIARAIWLSALTIFVPLIGAVATIVNVRKRKKFQSKV